MNDIGGDWDGVYSYGGRQRDFPAAHFGAVFTAADAGGGFTGVITDAHGLGAAGAVGAVEGVSVRFVKTYRWSRATWPDPVHYEGTFSVDGQTAHGTWQIRQRLLWLFPRRFEGVWRMQRPGLPPMQAVWPPPPQEPE